jgi:hypothetical protein
MRCFAMFSVAKVVFSVAKVVKTFGSEPGIVESLDDFRYKILSSVGSGGFLQFNAGTGQVRGYAKSKLLEPPMAADLARIARL